MVHEKIDINFGIIMRARTGTIRGQCHIRNVSLGIVVAINVTRQFNLFTGD